jgi:hypothetical protein
MCKAKQQASGSVLAKRFSTGGHDQIFQMQLSE